MGYKMTGSELMRSGKTFSNAMWEYSWLLQREGRQAEYADWDKVLDELVERGYDCLRLDAFPHNIAKGKDGKIIEEFDLVRDNNFGWTRNEPCRFNPRKGLIEFMQKCKDRGIYVGLSSWYRPDTTHRELEVETPEDYARIWTETLDLLAENDLLDGICWVDLCNEFPTPQWAPGVKLQLETAEPISKEMYQALGLPEGAALPSTIAVVMGLSEDSKVRLSEFMKRAITPVREKYPDLLYTFSEVNMPNSKYLDYSACDLRDIHIWSVSEPEWSEVSEGNLLYQYMLAGDHSLLEGHQASALMHSIEMCCEKYPEYKEKIRIYFENEMKEIGEIARKNDMILVTTESWATVLYDDVYFGGALGEWDWCKEVDQEGLEIALKNGWTSVCTSNFCEPHFEGMWYDVEWHKRMNTIIKGR